jgi:hypothetical protein
MPTMTDRLEELRTLMARCTAEEINEVLAERGWKLAYKPSAKQGYPLPPEDVTTEPLATSMPALTESEEKHTLDILRANLSVEDRLRRVEHLTLYDDPLTHKLADGISKVRGKR